MPVNSNITNGNVNLFLSGDLTEEGELLGSGIHKADSIYLSNDITVENFLPGTTFLSFERFDGRTRSSNGDFHAISGTDNANIISLAGLRQMTEDGTVVIDGLGGDDVLTGTNGSQRILGGWGNDIIDAGEGNDSVNAGAGDDMIIDGGGRDYINGGSGTDTVFFKDVIQDITGTLGEAGVAAQFASPVGPSNAGINKLVNVENLIGGFGHDYFTGNSGDNAINGADGDDIVNGGDGNDILEGGAGSDQLNGDAGDDTVNAASGDTTDGGADTDTLNLMVTNGQFSSIVGDGELGKLLDYFDVADLEALLAETNPKPVSGELELTSIDFSAKNFEFAELMIFEEMPTLLDASGPGVSNVADGPLLGTSGNDFSLRDDPFSDTTIIGFEGSDRLYGNGGMDVMLGGRGNDDIFLGLAGGDEVDVVGTIVDGGDGGDTIRFMSDIVIDRLDSTMFMNVERIDPRVGGDAATIFGTAGDNMLDLSGLRNISPGGKQPQTVIEVNGRGGDDTISGTDSNDKLLGGDGQDVINGNGGNDYLSGGNDDDIISDGNGRDYVNGGDGDDTFLIGDGHDTLVGGAGADTFVFGEGRGGNKIVDFEAGEDILELDGVSVVGHRKVNDGADLKIDLSSGASVTLLGIDEYDAAMLFG